MTDTEILDWLDANPTRLTALAGMFSAAREQGTFTAGPDGRLQLVPTLRETLAHMLDVQTLTDQLAEQAGIEITRPTGTPPSRE